MSSSSSTAAGTGPASEEIAADKAMKMRILCLHGRNQSAASFTNKIAGARKKLQRVYDLDFLDGPIVLEGSSSSPPSSSAVDPDMQRAWWYRHEDGSHVNVKETLEYVIQNTQGKNYDAILGFSQGGLLGTALVGLFPTVKAVLTAGSPFHRDPFCAVEEIMVAAHGNLDAIDMGKAIPKLHFAGETDAMVPVASTQLLSDEGGNGQVFIHEKGHMFPTKAAYVAEMLNFLESALGDDGAGTSRRAD